MRSLCCSQLRGGTGVETGEFQAKVGNVGARAFLDLFDLMTWRDDDNVIGPLRKFLSNATGTGHINDWTIMWPQPARGAGEFVVIDGFGPAHVVARNRRPDGRGLFGSSPSHRAPGLLIARGEIVEGVRISGGPKITWPAVGGRGVALVYLVDDRRPADRSSRPPTEGEIAALISLAVPASATPRKRDLIQWAARVQSQKDHATVRVIDLAI